MDKSSSTSQHPWKQHLFWYWDGCLFSWICQGVVNMRQFALCCGIYRQSETWRLGKHRFSSQGIVWSEYKVFFVVLGELEISISASWDRYWAFHILEWADNISESRHNFQIEIIYIEPPKGLRELVWIRSAVVPESHLTWVQHTVAEHPAGDQKCVSSIPLWIWLTERRWGAKGEKSKLSLGFGENW